MATSGTLGVLSGQWKSTYTVTWNLLSQDKVNAISKIRLTSTFYTGNSTTIHSTHSDFRTDGTVMYSSSYSKTGAGNVFVATKDIEVQHNSDGTFPNRLVTFSAWDYGAFAASPSGSGIITGVPDIPRANTVACSSPYIGDTAIITIDRKVESFTSTVTYEIGTLTGTIAEKTSEKVLSLDTSALKDEIYALMPDAKELEAKIKCETYSGDTKIGDTQEATFNLYAKESECRPEVSGTIVDTNEATASYGKFVKYLSKPKVTIEAAPKYSSSIKSYSINLNDGQSSTLQEETFESIGSNSITINATDSRGYDNPQTIELEMIEYVKLHIDNIDISRTEDVSKEVVLNANGVWFNGNFNEENANTLTAKFQYNAGAGWVDGGTITPTIEGNTFKFVNTSLGNIYDFNSEYQFKIIVSDSLTTTGNENKEAITVPKGQEVVAIGEDSVWVYGELLLNDENILDKIPEAPTIMNEYSDSGNNSYSCNYVNKLNLYTEEEVRIGTWFGKPLYRKVVSMGALPNATLKNTAHGISNLGFVTKLTGMAYNPASGSRVTLPYADPNPQYIVMLYANDNYVVLNTIYNQSGFTESYAIMEYIKTTD